MYLYGCILYPVCVCVCTITCMGTYDALNMHSNAHKDGHLINMSCPLSGPEMVNRVCVCANPIVFDTLES